MRCATVVEPKSSTSRMCFPSLTIMPLSKKNCLARFRESVSSFDERNMVHDGAMIRTCEPRVSLGGMIGMAEGVCPNERLLATDHMILGWDTFQSKAYVKNSIDSMQEDHPSPARVACAGEGRERVLDDLECCGYLRHTLICIFSLPPRRRKGEERCRLALQRTVVRRVDCGDI